MATQDEPSYIDYEAFLAPDFNPRAFANSLILLTNNPSDLPLDLSTPLSRVLFDIQEVDSHIDTLTTRSAIPLLQYTGSQAAASKRIVSELEPHVRSLNESYKQLERDVIDRHAEAEEVRVVASRLWETLRLGRAAGRCLQLGRQLEVQRAEVSGGTPSTTSTTTTTAAGRREDHRALVRCSYTILSLREVLERNKPGEEGFGLDKIDAVRSVREAVVAPSERFVRESAERIVREFAVPDSATFNQAEEAKARLVSALHALYLLSPVNWDRPAEKWVPRLLIQALEAYMRAAIQAAATTLVRGLGQLPSLDRALAEVSARCQNVLALELVLGATRAPTHTLLPEAAQQQQHKSQGPLLLQPLLAHLETGSLASYFWRTLAGGVSSRVQELVSRGGVAVRTLKTNKASVGESLRECVLRGSKLPSPLTSSGSGKDKKSEEAKWDREVAVMVGSVLNHLGR